MKNGDKDEIEMDFSLAGQELPDKCVAQKSRR